MKTQTTVKGKKRDKVREIYNYYKENRLEKSNIINEYKYFEKYFNTLVKSIQEAVGESENGVYLENFLYIRTELVETTRRLKNSPLRRGKKEYKIIELEPLFLLDHTWKGYLHYSIKNKIKKGQPHKLYEIKEFLGIKTHYSYVKRLHKKDKFIDGWD